MPDPLAPSSNRLRWEHAALADLDRACTGLLEALTAAHDQARALAERPHWGLGEADPALHSAAALAELFREKASDTPGGVGGALAAHTAEVTEFRDLIAAVCAALPDIDTGSARRLDGPLS
ncbi:hypothetical protein [Nocardia farcinica]|uniref:hypothetical protein n=1 Tax=Nocardia farcinica TaxID=37329 RepID=UPI001893AB80|nr:hypothetical protein [Nocardia farcinica]MBF6143069.1 hypothetical protein [Nocardia farcinica]